MSQSIRPTEVGVRRFRRLLTRALIVTGGSIAATAAAWVLTTAVASAEELDMPSSLSAVSNTVEARNPTPISRSISNPTAIGHSVSNVEGKLSEAPTLPIHSGSQVAQVTEKIHGAVTGVSSAVTPRLAELAESAPISIANTSPDTPTSLVTSLDEVTQAKAATIPSTTSSSEAKSVTQTSLLATSPTDDALQSGVSAVVPAGNPFNPPSPVNFPAHCVCGGDGASYGGKNLSGFFGSSKDFSAPLAGVLRSALVRIPVAVGEATGVTPD